MSFTGRDDADDFFAIVVLPVRVNDKQHGSFLNPCLDSPDRMPSLLATLIVPVRINQTSFIIKDQGRIFE